MMKKWICSFLCGASLTLYAAPIQTVEEYPAVIIGSGVAALTAATYLGRAGITPMVIEGETIGGAITQSQKIQNWPGELEITGSALAEKLYAQAQGAGAHFLKEKVIAVDFSKSPFLITTQALLGNQVKTLRAKTCIIALGSTPNFLNIPGEQKYWSSGVYSCAVCDGSLYRNQVVAVVGGGDSALVDTEYLASLASRVFLIVRSDRLKATELKRVEHIAAHPKVTILYDTIVKQVLGNDTQVMGLKIENTKTKKENNLPVDALFIKIGSTPNTVLFQQQLSLDSQGYIVVKAGQETSVSGVFAAGDIADPEFQQAICAAGDGAKAALQAQRMLGKQIGCK